MRCASGLGSHPLGRITPPFLAAQNRTTYSLAVSTGWNNPPTICLLKKTQSPPSVVLEGWVQVGLRHFDLATVFQLHVHWITLHKTSTHWRKYLQELQGVVPILWHRHKVSIEGHQSPPKRECPPRLGSTATPEPSNALVPLFALD